MLFWLNLYVCDFGYIFMFGLIGVGKLMYLVIFVVQFCCYVGMLIFVFDKGMLMYLLVVGICVVMKGISGLYFIVVVDDECLVFCLLQFLSIKGDCVWVMEWIDIILVLNGVEMILVQCNEIGNVIMSMYVSGVCMFFEFSVMIQDEVICEVICQYIVDGVMGYLFDVEEDGLVLFDFIVFEIEELMNFGEKFVLFVLFYLFCCIECVLMGQLVVIILDEVWLMFGYLVFCVKIREWFKVLCKVNCFVLMVMQSLFDVVNSGILDVIVELIVIKIFLLNIYVRDEDMVVLYCCMGLNVCQIEILVQVVFKCQYYYVLENGCCFYDLVFGLFVFVFVGVFDKEFVVIIKNLEVKFGDQWVDEWLCGWGFVFDEYLEVV